MKRFHPTSRPITLQNKAISTIGDQRFMPPSQRRCTVQVAACLGMDAETRAALARLLSMAENRKTAVAGIFIPDGSVSRLLAERGIAEQVNEADFGRFRKIATPYCGITATQRRTWEHAGICVEDLSSPKVRRGQVALGLLRVEGAQGLVIGRHDDPETVAIASGCAGTLVIEDTTDTARLRFAPAFGAVCQTTLSPRKVAWLVQQLRFRYRDARVTFLDTTCPAMAARDEALEKLLVTCDQVVIVGRPGEASCEALAETAMRRGKPAVIVSGPDDLNPADFAGKPRVALTAGAFAMDETIRAVAGALADI